MHKIVYSKIKSRRLRFTIPLLLALLLTLVAACTPEHPQSTFGTAGPVAEEQANLFNYIFIISIFVFVIVEGLIIYFAWRYRRVNEKIPKQIHGNTALELTWTIIPAIIIIAVAIPTVQSIWRTSVPPDEGMEITSIGHQWWFEFRYPSQGIITANEMVIPVDENIIITLESQDVIHSFWVPKLAGKVDMVPITKNLLWLRADQPGTYYGLCAEFCGTSHAHMRFRVIAMEREDFNQWVDQWFIPPSRPAPGSPEAEGQALFAANCSTCHTTNSHSDGSYQREIVSQNQRWESWQNAPETSPLVSAPNLTHFAIRTTIGAGERELNAESVEDWITNPASIKPGTRMQQNALAYRSDPEKANARGDYHPISLNVDEVRKIAAYLLSLKPNETVETSSTNQNELTFTEDSIEEDGASLSLADAP